MKHYGKYYIAEPKRFIRSSQQARNNRLVGKGTKCETSKSSFSPFSIKRVFFLHFRMQKFYIILKLRTFFWSKQAFNWLYKPPLNLTVSITLHCITNLQKTYDIISSIYCMYHTENSVIKKTATDKRTDFIIYRWAYKMRLTGKTSLKMKVLVSMLFPTISSLTLPGNRLNI